MTIKAARRKLGQPDLYHGWLLSYHPAPALSATCPPSLYLSLSTSLPLYICPSPHLSLSISLPLYISPSLSLHHFPQTELWQSLDYVVN